MHKKILSINYRPKILGVESCMFLKIIAHYFFQGLNTAIQTVVLKIALLVK